MSNECMELKNIKYKSMLLSGTSEEKKETVENLSKEINHFKKKYKLEFNIIADNNLNIHLLNYHLSNYI